MSDSSGDTSELNNGGNSFPEMPNEEHANIIESPDNGEQEEEEDLNIFHQLRLMKIFGYEKERKQKVIRILGASVITGSGSYGVPTLQADAQFCTTPGIRNLELINDEFGYYAYWTDGCTMNSTFFNPGNERFVESNSKYLRTTSPFVDIISMGYATFFLMKRRGMSMAGLWINDRHHGMIYFSAFLRYSGWSMCPFVSEFSSYPLVLGIDQKIYFYFGEYNAVYDAISLDSEPLVLAQNKKNEILVGLRNGDTLKFDLDAWFRNQDAAIEPKCFKNPRNSQSPVAKIIPVEDDGAYIFYEKNSIAYVNFKQNDAIFTVQDEQFNDHQQVACLLENGALLVNLKNVFKMFLDGHELMKVELRRFDQYDVIKAVPKSWPMPKIENYNGQWVIGIRNGKFEAFPVFLRVVAWK